MSRTVNLMQFLSGRLLRVCSRFVTSFLHILDAGKSTCSPLIFNKISRRIGNNTKIQYTEGLENVVGSREEGDGIPIFSKQYSMKVSSIDFMMKLHPEVLGTPEEEKCTQKNCT